MLHLTEISVLPVFSATDFLVLLYAHVMEVHDIFVVGEARNTKMSKICL